MAVLALFGQLNCQSKWHKSADRSSVRFYGPDTIMVSCKQQF